MCKPERDMLAHNPRPDSARAGLSTALWAAAIAALAGFAAVYVTLGRPDNADRPGVQAHRAAVAQAGRGAGRARQQTR